MTKALKKRMLEQIRKNIETNGFHIYEMASSYQTYAPTGQAGGGDHEAWLDGETIGEHWGKVGEIGNHSKHKRDRKISVEKNLRRVLETATSGGYTVQGPDDWQSLRIEYKIDWMGTAKDVAKRHKLEKRLEDTLGKTGLGQVDGGSSGSGTMEVRCSVVNFRLAKQIIQADLAGTSFADYSKIVNEDA